MSEGQNVEKETSLRARAHRWVERRTQGCYSGPTDRRETTNDQAHPCRCGGRPMTNERARPTRMTPEQREIVREAMAQAWDEGYVQRVVDEADKRKPAPNPYRADRPAEEQQ